MVKKTIPLFKGNRSYYLCCIGISYAVPLMRSNSCLRVVYDSAALFFSSSMDSSAQALSSSGV